MPDSSGMTTEAKLADLREALEAKVRGAQDGVPTFFDNYLLRGLRALAEGGGPLTSPRGQVQLSGLLNRLASGRFQDVQTRHVLLPGQAPRRTEVEPQDMRLSQGAWEVLQWRGMPLFKTVFDFALYPMLLWEVKPRTVIELGSGSGASALWLGDLMQTFGIDGQVVSLDLKKPQALHDRVRFIEGDCARIAEAFPDLELATLPHPWIVLEGAHVNVLGVLLHFHRQTRPGDYLVVEDSAQKGDDLSRFAAECPGCYKLDSRYTDFFGQNATACMDSFLRRVGGSGAA